MQRGAFRGFRHVHTFEAVSGGTLMADEFAYTSPLGPLGRVADALFLERYMRRLLVERNAYLRSVLETGRTPEARSIARRCGMVLEGAGW
jgi:ligand-binding SRPBCC domain-containing protein